MPDTAEKPRRMKIDTGMGEAEELKFKTFLKATGRKAGPFVRTLILKAMDDEAKREAPHA